MSIDISFINKLILNLNNKNNRYVKIDYKKLL